MSTRDLVRSTGLMPSMFDEFFRPWNEWFDETGTLGRMMTIPAVNITDEKEDYRVSLAVPGMKKDDFKIDLEGNVMTISCENEERKEEKDKKFTRKEYNFTSFSRSFTMPNEVNREKIDAKYVDGVLEISLPKKEEARKAIVSKHIAVK